MDIPNEVKIAVAQATNERAVEQARMERDARVFASALLYRRKNKAEHGGYKWRVDYAECEHLARMWLRNCPAPSQRRALDRAHACLYTSPRLAFSYVLAWHIINRNKRTSA